MTTRELNTKAEQHARVLRNQAGIGRHKRFDPIELAERLGILVVYPADIDNLSDEERERLSSMDASTWSGGAQNMPDGRLLIILNPNQTEARKRVTVLEEIAHDHFGHTPTRLTGMADRRYDAEQEDEAYWTAAAALLPSREVGRAVWRGESAEELARRFGASVELAEMRIKTLGLWDEYVSDQEVAT